MFADNLPYSGYFHDMVKMTIMKRLLYMKNKKIKSRVVQRIPRIIKSLPHDGMYFSNDAAAHSKITKHCSTELNNVL